MVSSTPEFQTCIVTTVLIADYLEANTYWLIGQTLFSCSSLNRAYPTARSPAGKPDIVELRRSARSIA